jgi:hypothetical protein
LQFPTELPVSAEQENLHAVNCLPWRLPGMQEPDCCRCSRHRGW